MTMTLDELRDYSCWVGKSALDISNAVARHRGWSRVFAYGRRIPIWAHKVRNYFNLTPVRLTLLDKSVSEILIKNNVNPRYHNYISKNNAATRLALSGSVYVDNHSNVWFQMDAGSTVYHAPGSTTDKAAIALSLKGQSHSQVFKLVQPDPLGGSREVCIKNERAKKGTPTKNPHRDVAVLYGYKPRGPYQLTVGREGQRVVLGNRVITDRQFFGTYNYSETITKGLENHDIRDVRPHKTHGFDYEVPPARASSVTELALRKFPANDRHGKDLAGQI